MENGIRAILKLGRNRGYDQALAAYNEGGYEEALAGFAKVEAEASHTTLHAILARFHKALTHRNLGLLDLHQGRSKSAAAHFQEASGLLRDDPRLDYLRAVALSRAGEHESALARMEQAALGLKGMRIQVALAVANLNSGRAEAAYRILNPLAAGDPHYPDIRFYLARALIRIGRPSQAVEHLETALRINPLYEQARATLGRVLGLLGQEDRGLEFLEDKEPDHERWKKELEAPCPVALELGELLYRLDKSDQGLSKTLALIFEEDLIENPHWPDLHYRLGLIYRNLEMWELALAAFNRACEINPYYARACEELGDLLQEMGGGDLRPDNSREEP